MIVDLLGIESRDLKSQQLFYIYDDGTIEKKNNYGGSKCFRFSINGDCFSYVFCKEKNLFLNVNYGF
jgi:hypothetical protein